MSVSRSRGYVKLTAMLASLLVTCVMFRSLVSFSEVKNLPDPSFFPVIDLR